MQHPCVLVVDDDHDTRDSLRMLLEACFPQIDVVALPGGPEALYWLRMNRCDAMVADYAMPSMDGGRLLEEVAKVAPQARRILMSGLPEQEVSRLLGAPADLFLAKPFEATELAAAVAEALGVAATQWGLPPGEASLGRSVHSAHPPDRASGPVPVA